MGNQHCLHQLKRNIFYNKNANIVKMGAPSCGEIFSEGVRPA